MYLISYDISQTKRRNKIFKELKNYGKYVKFSVFECELDKKRYLELYGKLLKNPGRDAPSKDSCSSPLS